MAAEHLTLHHPGPAALIAALTSADACIAGAEAIAGYRPDPAALVALLDGAERYINQARAALVAAEGVKL